MITAEKWEGGEGEVRLRLSLLQHKRGVGRKQKRKEEPTSFPGSLILLPHRALQEGGKMRDPGNEVENEPVFMTKFYFCLKFLHCNGKASSKS